jgi:hypothetical protein
MLAILSLTNFIDLQTHNVLFSIFISYFKEHSVDLFCAKNINRIGIVNAGLHSLFMIYGTTHLCRVCFILAVSSAFFSAQAQLSSDVIRKGAFRTCV